MVKNKTNKVATPETPETTTETKTNEELDANEYRASVQHRWIEFTAQARCYIEGISLEAGQTVTFSPAASYRHRMNAHIAPTTEVKWPTLTVNQVKDLAEGDPKVGSAPKEFTLVQPGSGQSK